MRCGHRGLLRTLAALAWATLLVAVSAAAGDKSAPVAPAFPFDAAAAQAYQAKVAQALGLPAAATNRLGMKLVLVPPGKFVMGSPTEEPDRSGGELPHEVTLTRAFYVGQHEVTREQFQRFVDAKKHVTDVERNGGGHAHDEKAVWEHHPGTSWRKPGYAGAYEPHDAHPVVHVSHNDARAFCTWLNDEAGEIEGLDARYTYRLPTEAEWEWSCRAGSAGRFWWGDELDQSGQVANVGDRSLKKMHPAWPRAIMPMDDGHAYVAPVGSYRANAFGLCDMLGNVWEFCHTRHGPYGKEPATDPGDLGEQESYSVRGGGWSNFPSDCRCAMRNSDPPKFGHSNLGFRVVVEMGEGS